TEEEVMPSTTPPEALQNPTYAYGEMERSERARLDMPPPPPTSHDRQPGEWGSHQGQNDYPPPPPLEGVSPETPFGVAWGAMPPLPPVPPHAPPSPTSAQQEGGDADQPSATPTREGNN